MISLCLWIIQHINFNMAVYYVTSCATVCSISCHKVAKCNCHVLSMYMPVYHDKSLATNTNKFISISPTSRLQLKPFSYRQVAGIQRKHFCSCVTRQLARSKLCTIAVIFANASIIKELATKSKDLKSQPYSYTMYVNMARQLHTLCTARVNSQLAGYLVHFCTQLYTFIFGSSFCGLMLDTWHSSKHSLNLYIFAV